MKADRSQAERFLERLAQSPVDSTEFTFQTFDDGPEGRRELARVLRGTLDQVWPSIVRLQAQGAGAFVTVNETTGTGRAAGDVIAARSVFRDVDQPTAAELPLQEHMRVRTANGFHDYLLCRTTDLQEWDRVMRTMVQSYGADKKAIDRSRVLRLPGTLHLKDRTRPFLVTLERVADRPPYEWREVIAAIPPAENTVTSPTSQAPGVAREDDAELVRQVANGENYHGALLTLTSRYAARGMSQDDILATLRGVLKAHDDGSDRFKARLNGLPRQVTSAVAKFGPGAVHAQIVATIEAAKAAGYGSVDFVEAVLPKIADARSLKPAEVDDLLKRVKAETGTTLETLREELRARNTGATGLGLTHADYAMALLETLTKESGDVAPVGAEGRIWTAGPSGVWSGRPAADFEVEIGRQFSGQKNCQRRSDYLGIAAHAYALAAQGNEGFFDAAPIGVAGPLGFYRLDASGDLLLEELRPDHRQRFALGFDPDFAQPMPLFDKFLAETFASADSERSHAQVGAVQEVMGAVALGLLAKHEKVVLFLGEGRAGKGTLLKVTEALVPSQWRAATPPHRWDEEYYAAQLAGKRLNVVGELSEDRPIEAAAFKTVTGRDLLTGRHPSGRPFEFRNEAAHIFNSNFFVPTRDHSDAFFSRWIIVQFPNGRLRAGGAIDPDLAKKMIEAEMPGILGWALLGAARLQKRGRFAPTAVHDELMAKWRRRTDSVLEFLHDDEVVVLDPAADAKRSEVYGSYLVWCSRSSRRPLGLHRFNDAIECPAAVALGLQVRRESKRREVVCGLRLVDAPVAFQ